MNVEFLSQHFHFPFSPSLRGSLVSPHFLQLWYTCISEVVDISPTILIPACKSSNPALHMTYSVYKLNKSCLVAVCVLNPFSYVQLLLTSWTACQAPMSMGFYRQEYWNGLPFPSSGDLSDPGIESVSLAAPVLQADSLQLSQEGSLVMVVNHIPGQRK